MEKQKVIFSCTLESLSNLILFLSFHNRKHLPISLAFLFYFSVPHPTFLSSKNKILLLPSNHGLCDYREGVLSRFSRFWLFVTLWTLACQIPLSMKFSRQEYWSGFAMPSSRNLPEPRLFRLLHWQTGSLPLAPPGKPEREGLSPKYNYCLQNEISRSGIMWVMH